MREKYPEKQSYQETNMSLKSTVRSLQFSEVKSDGMKWVKKVLSVAISISNHSLKTQPSTVKFPIQINGLSNLYMPILCICVRYGYFLISLKSSQTPLRCSLPDYYIIRAAAKRTQAILSSVSN